MERKQNLKPRIGLYTMGLRAYWTQIVGLEDRMKLYGAFIAEKLEAMGAEVVHYDLVDTEDTGLAAGEMFNAHNVDLIFAHAGTYVNSSCVLPTHHFAMSVGHNAAKLKKVAKILDIPWVELNK